MSGEEFHFLCEHYSDVIEYEFSHKKAWPRTMESPRAAVDDEEEFLMFSKRVFEKLNQGNTSQSVYIAEAGFCDLAFSFPKNTVIEGCTHDYETEPDEEWALGQIRLQAAGYHSEITPSYVPSTEKYDFICATQWFDYNSELLNNLSDKGRMFLVVNDFDYAEQQKIYDYMSRNYSLKSVVYKKFRSDCIFGGDAGYLFISIDCNGGNNVLMRYENKDIECRVKYKDLDCKKALLPTYYLTDKPKIGIPLSSIAEIVRFRDARSTKGLADETEVIEVLEEKFHKVVKPIDNSHHVADYRKDENEWALSSIKQPCLLFGGRDEFYGLRVVKSIPKLGYATKGGFVQFVPKEGIDLFYLAATLLRPEVKSQIMGFCDEHASSFTIEPFMDNILIQIYLQKKGLSLLVKQPFKQLLLRQMRCVSNKKTTKKVFG